MYYRVKENQHNRVYLLQIYIHNKFSKTISSTLKYRYTEGKHNTTDIYI